LLRDQYASGFAVSANWVPPTQVTEAEEHSALMAAAWSAGGASLWFAQPAAPLSPDETNTEMPSIAA
jgi:hypothetical protein